MAVRRRNMFGTDVTTIGVVGRKLFGLDSTHQGQEEGTLRMNSFKSAASQLFMTAPDGRRVLCLDGPFFKPYVVPDQETESRLRDKVASRTKMLYWFLFVGVLVGASFVPDSWPQGAVVLSAGLLAAVIAKLVMLSVTRELKRAPARVPLSQYYGSIARHRSWAGVWVGLIFTSLFIAVAAFMLMNDEPITGTVGLAIFGPLALSWGYIIKRKLELE
jgi:hypothetical protein